MLFQVQPEQFGQGLAYEFWQRLWEQEQDSFDQNSKNMNQLSSSIPQSMDSFILLDENDYAKGLKRKREGSNKASTAMGLTKNRKSLIGKYDGCPWLIKGKHYSKGIVG